MNKPTEVSVFGTSHILHGNSDLPDPEWNPPKGEPERQALPGEEHKANLRNVVYMRLQEDGLIGRSECSDELRDEVLSPKRRRLAHDCGWHRHERDIAAILLAAALFLCLLYLPELLAAFRGTP